MPLPIVAEGTLASVKHTLRDYIKEDRLEELFLRVTRENPGVATFISHATEVLFFQDEEAAAKASLICFLTYRLLESQQEANDLAEKIE